MGPGSAPPCPPWPPKKRSKKSSKGLPSGFVLSSLLPGARRRLRCGFLTVDSVLMLTTVGSSCLEIWEKALESCWGAGMVSGVASPDLAVSLPWTQASGAKARILFVRAPPLRVRSGQALKAGSTGRYFHYFHFPAAQAARSITLIAARPEN